MPPQDRFDVDGIEFCCTVAPSAQMIDYNGHLNVACYGALFEDAARAVFSRLDISQAYRERTDRALFAVEAHSVFHREVLAGEAVSIHFRILDFDGRKVHCMFFMTKTRDGSLAATQEILFLHVDLSARRVSPIPEPQAGHFIDLIHKHGQLPTAADAGRSVGLRRRRSTAGATGAGR